MKQDLLARMRQGDRLTRRMQLLLIAQLSLPTILAQLSITAMEYIDAAMVGHLGANASAAVGLVASSTWLVSSLCMACCIGFTVQIAQHIGAEDQKSARRLLKQALVVACIMGGILATVCVMLSGWLPRWLGGLPEVCVDASSYFRIFGLFLPAIFFGDLAASALQCSGNMKLPSILEISKCGLNVIFNFLLIFPSRDISLKGVQIHMPGAGLGVAGAALGTGISTLIVTLILLYFLLARSPSLHLRKGEPLQMLRSDLTRALQIALPVAGEQIIMCGAQIASTRIVAPLGTIAIAAHSFGITIEGLCYMPGYGISTAATTMIGQCIGAGRTDLTKRLSWFTTLLGMIIMTGTGILMYVFAPHLIALLTPDPDIQQLCTTVLRIEAFAEPMYAASIVATGVFRGAGDTLIPSCMNFFCMWIVRLPAAAFLATRIGLRGVWIAMCFELCVRGIIFLVRLSGDRWRSNSTTISRSKTDT